MMARARHQTEAERLRQHNQEMKLAVAENVTVLEARRRLAVRRWREFEEAMDRRRRCGTADGAGQGQLQSDYDASPSAAAAQQPHYWWQDRD